jgi:hypothetical protein
MRQGGYGSAADHLPHFQIDKRRGLFHPRHQLIHVGRR